MRRMARGSLLLSPDSMDALALTIFISICLAGIFIVCFASEWRRSKNSSPERDSLLPLEDDSPADDPSGK
jgi:hypothetical protein